MCFLHITGRHRHSAPHVSWSIGETSRTEVAVRADELSGCALYCIMLAGPCALIRFWVHPVREGGELCLYTASLIHCIYILLDIQQNL